MTHHSKPLNIEPRRSPGLVPLYMHRIDASLIRRPIGGPQLPQRLVQVRGCLLRECIDAGRTTLYGRQYAHGKGRPLRKSQLSLGRRQALRIYFPHLWMVQTLGPRIHHRTRSWSREQLDVPQQPRTGRPDRFASVVDILGPYVGQ